MASESTAAQPHIRSIETLEGPTTIRLPDGRYLALDGSPEEQIEAHVRRAELMHGRENSVIP